MIVNGWARLEYLPPEASVEKLVNASPLVTYSRRSPASEPAGCRPMSSAMSPQDVGLVSLGLMRLAAPVIRQGGSLPPSSAKLASQALRAGALIPEARWDLQALANAISAYSMFRTHSLAHPRAVEASDEQGGEAALAATVCEAIVARPVSVFAGREQELAAIVSSLPACGATWGARPLVWSRLAQAALALPAVAGASAAVTSQQLTMLIDGFVASGMLDAVAPAPSPPPTSSDADSVSCGAVRAHLKALAKCVIEVAVRESSPPQLSLSAGVSMASLLSSVQAIGEAETVLSVWEAALPGGQNGGASAEGKWELLRPDDAAIVLSVLEAETGGMTGTYPRLRCAKRAPYQP